MKFFLSFISIIFILYFKKSVFIDSALTVVAGSIIPVLCLFHLSTVAAACCGFAAVGLAGI